MADGGNEMSVIIGSEDFEQALELKAKKRRQVEAILVEVGRQARAEGVELTDLELGRALYHFGPRGEGWRRFSQADDRLVKQGAFDDEDEEGIGA
jgi:hypothetical protein